MDYETGRHISDIVANVAATTANRFVQQSGNLLGDTHYNLLVFRAILADTEISLIRAGYDHQTRQSFYPGEIILDAMNVRGYEALNDIYTYISQTDQLYGIDAAGLTI